MYLEYCMYDKAFVEDFELQTRKLFRAVDLKFNGVALPLYAFREMKRYIWDLDLSTAVSIDYPTGTSDRRVRLHESLVALKEGANTIDVVICPYLIRKNKYNKIKEDLTSHLRMCDDYGATLRAVLNYDLHRTKQILNVAEAVEDAGVDYLIPSNGFHRDDIYNNILISNTIENYTNINVVSSGHIWLEEQYQAAISSNIFGLRLYSLSIFDNYINEIHKI